MKPIFHLTALLYLPTILLCCTRPTEDISHWADASDEISMSIQEEIIMEFREATWQTGHTRHEFWAVQDDMDMFFRIRLEQIPVLGEKTNGTLIYKTLNNSSQKRAHLSFETVKTDDSGKSWLYNHSQHIGLVIGPMAD